MICANNLGSRWSVCSVRSGQKRKPLLRSKTKIPRARSYLGLLAVGRFLAHPANRSGGAVRLNFRGGFPEEKPEKHRCSTPPVRSASTSRATRGRTAAMTHFAVPKRQRPRGHERARHRILRCAQPESCRRPPPNCANHREFRTKDPVSSLGRPHRSRRTPRGQRSPAATRDACAHLTNSPSRIGRISSQRLAISGLCVTSTTAWPFSFARRVRRSKTIAEFFWSKLPVGSSARMIAG